MLSNVKRILFILIKLGITLMIFYVIFNRIDMVCAFDFPSLEKGFLVQAFLLVLVLVFLQGFRWHFLLQAMGLQSDLLSFMCQVSPTLGIE